MNNDELLTEAQVRTGLHAAFVREWVGQVADTVTWLRTEAAKHGIEGSNRDARRRQHKLGLQSCSEKILEEEIPMEEYDIAEGQLIEFQASAEWLRATWDQGMTCSGVYPCPSRDDPPNVHPSREDPQMANMATVSPYRDLSALDMRPLYRELSARQRNPSWARTTSHTESYASANQSLTDSSWCGVREDDADSASCFGSPLGTTSTCCSDGPISRSSGSPASSSRSIPVSGLSADGFSRALPSAGSMQVPHLVDSIGRQGALHRHVDIGSQRLHQRSTFPSCAGPVAKSSEAKRTQEIGKTCAFLEAQIERLTEYLSKHEAPTAQEEEERGCVANSRGAGQGLGERGIHSSPYRGLTRGASSPFANQRDPRISHNSRVNEAETVEERGCRAIPRGAGLGEPGIPTSLPYRGLTQGAGSPLAYQRESSISHDSTVNEAYALIDDLFVELKGLKHKLEAG